MWDNRTVATGLRQSEKSRQTDLKVALSAARAVRTVGIDQMALTKVAADAGFSSGAIYARCDDRSELVVLAWEKCFWPMLRELLEVLLRAVTTKDAALAGTVSELFARHSSDDATPDLGSAMEVVVVGRRDEVIGEVVQRDINGLLDDWGVGPSTDGPERQAVVAALSTIFGTALLNSAYHIPGFGPIDPSPLLDIYISARATPTKPPAVPRPAVPRDPMQFPATGDEVRDALVAATEFVIARSGVHRATISRIARRAGVSVGAIYGLYENKDSLVGDCLDVLYPPYMKRDTNRWMAVFGADDQRAAVTRILVDNMGPDQAQWRSFRLECLVAARHSPPIARQIARFASIARERLFEASLGAPATAMLRPDTGFSARSSITGVSIVEIVDPTVTGLDWRWLPVGAAPQRN